MKPAEVKSMHLEVTTTRILNGLQLNIERMIKEISPVRPFEYGSFNYYTIGGRVRQLTAMPRYPVMDPTPINLERITNIIHLIEFMDYCDTLIGKVFRVTCNYWGEPKTAFSMLPKELNASVLDDVNLLTVNIDSLHTKEYNNFWYIHAALLTELKEMLLKVKLMS